METVNQTNYKPKAGRKVKGKTLVQLAEYQPLQKMLANLTIAGLNASARQAMEYYDGNVGDPIDIPLLPRHIAPDIQSVHEVAKYFGDQKRIIEERVQNAREKANAEAIKKVAELAQQAQQVAGAPPLAGSRGSAPPGQSPEK